MTLLHCPPPRPPLPGSLLVWPTEGNSYSLVITGRMMCALKCALPAWLPLTKARRGQRRGAQRGAKDRVRTERKWWERGVWPKRWILLLITRGIWPDKQYCALQMSIVWGISGATISIGGDGGGGGRERQMDRCEDCDMRVIQLRWLHVYSWDSQWQKKKSVQWNWKAVYWHWGGYFFLVG